MHKAFAAYPKKKAKKREALRKKQTVSIKECKRILKNRKYKRSNWLYTNGGKNGRADMVK